MAETFDEQLTLADVYAAALFALASETGAIEQTRSELEELVKLSDIEPRFAEFMRSDAVDDDHRRESLERMFRGKLSDTVLNTLQVMNDHGRAGLLPPLLRAFVLREEHAAGQIEVTATSAVELDESQRNAVKQLAAELSGKEPLVEYAVDPAVLGGLVLQIGDYRFDDSVRRHLQIAGRRLAERGDRGVRVAVQE